MFAKLIKATRASMGYHRACKLNNAKKYDDALKVLSQLETSPEYEARAELFAASILHRKGDIKASIRKYEHFLKDKVQFISKTTDQTYLTLYARYYLQNAMKRLDRGFVITIPRKQVEESYNKASYLVRNEFVF